MTATAEKPIETHTSALDEFHPNPAYHCGRLLAICQHIQNLAAGNVNATYVDRYYTAASSRPAHALVPVFRRAQHRLKQIKAGKARADVESLLTRTHNAFRAFPKTLTLIDQGDFQLGYFHQRPGLPAPDLRRRLPTLKGHAVKSAGEQFIADTLFVSGIEYEYEERRPLPGEEGTTIDPDFTIELCRDDHLLFVEYGGLSGDPQYDREWAWKSARYRKNLEARTFEDVLTDGRLTHHTLLAIVPDDLQSRSEGRQKVLQAVRHLQELAQRSSLAP